MKKGWRIFFKVVDAVVWLWNKIKPQIDKEINQDESPKK